MFSQCFHVEWNPEGRPPAAFDGADGGASCASCARRRKEHRLRKILFFSSFQQPSAPQPCAFITCCHLCGTSFSDRVCGILTCRCLCSALAQMTPAKSQGATRGETAPFLEFSILPLAGTSIFDESSDSSAYKRPILGILLPRGSGVKRMERSDRSTAQRNARR